MEVMKYGYPRMNITWVELLMMHLVSNSSLYMMVIIKFVASTNASGDELYMQENFQITMCHANSSGMA